MIPGLEMQHTLNSTTYIKCYNHEDKLKNTSNEVTWSIRLCKYHSLLVTPVGSRVSWVSTLPLPFPAYLLNLLELL